MSWKDRLPHYNPEVLAELTSAGLLRRAKKQLEKTELKIIEDSTERGLLEVAGHQITFFDAPLDKAQCDCDAIHLCIHIVTAVLHLNSEEHSLQKQAELTETEVMQQLIRLCQTDLFKWAGKPTTAKTALWWQKNQDISSQSQFQEQCILIQLNTGENCRYVHGLGLTGIICDASDSQKKAIVLRCLLAWLEQQKQEIAWPIEWLEDEQPDVVTEEDIIQADRVKAMLGYMLKVGIAHLPEQYARHIQQLAFGNRAQRLPRLAGQMLRLAESVEQLQSNGPLADPEALYKRLCLCWETCGSLKYAQEPKLIQDLKGSLRRQYQQVTLGKLWLCAATPYNTTSAKGLELLFQDLDSGENYIVNLGRWGAAINSFDLNTTLASSIGWQKSGSPLQHLGNVLTLDCCKISEDGKLSTSAETKLTDEGAAHTYLAILEKRNFKTWHDLQTFLATNLREDRRQYAIVAPRQATEFELDPQNQIWIAWLRDNKDQWLQLCLPSDKAHQDWINNFNFVIKSEQREVWGILLRFSPVNQGYQAQPLAMFLKDKEQLVQVQLSFQMKGRKAKSGLQKLLKSSRFFQKAHPANNRHQVNNQTMQLLLDLFDKQLARAELGVNVDLNSPHEIQDTLKQLQLANLPTLTRLIEQLEENNSPENLVKLSLFTNKMMNLHQISQLVNSYASN